MQLKQTETWLKENTDKLTEYREICQQPLTSLHFVDSHNENIAIGNWMRATSKIWNKIRSPLKFAHRTSAISSRNTTNTFLLAKFATGFKKCKNYGLNFIYQLISKDHFSKKQSSNGWKQLTAVALLTAPSWQAVSLVLWSELPASLSCHSVSPDLQRKTSSFTHTVI